MSNARVQVDFWEKAGKDLWGALAFCLSMFLLIQGGGEWNGEGWEPSVKRVGEIGNILSIVCLCGMIYVSVVFVKAKKINHS